ncbi:MAG: helix-turn-helix domain-containing protein [Promethearchaeota archaeon]
MIHRKTKIKIVNKILQSGEFRNSKLYQKLLKYLLNASLNNTPLKETTIAIDIFGKSANFNPSVDPKVRVYISNLRKKLEHYYLTEGKNERIIISIPKGQYKLKFIETDKPRAFQNKKNLISYAFFIFTLIIIIILIFYPLNLNKDINEEFDSNPIWQEYFSQNKTSTLITCGDYFFLYQHVNNRKAGYFVRDPYINSLEDFRATLRDNPQFANKFVDADNTYLGPNIIFSLIELFPILEKTHKEINFVLASKLKTEDIGKNNIIYIGSFKTLYLLREILNRINISYKIFPPKITIYNDPTDSISFRLPIPSKKKYKIDYSIIIKIKGPQNQTIMLLLGFYGVGIIGAVRTVTSLSSIEKVLKKYSPSIRGKQLYFILIKQVEGVEQTIFTEKLVYMKILNEEKNSIPVQNKLHSR